MWLLYQDIKKYLKKSYIVFWLPTLLLCDLTWMQGTPTKILLFSIVDSIKNSCCRWYDHFLILLIMLRGNFLLWVLWEVIFFMVDCFNENEVLEEFPSNFFLWSIVLTRTRYLRSFQVAHTLQEALPPFFILFYFLFLTVDFFFNENDRGSLGSIQVAHTL